MRPFRTAILAGFIVLVGCGSDDPSGGPPQAGDRGKLNGDWWSVVSRKCGAQALELQPDEAYRLDTTWVTIVNAESRTDDTLCLRAYGYHRLTQSGGGTNEEYRETATLRSMNSTKRQCWKLEAGKRVEPPTSSEVIKEPFEDLELRLLHTAAGVTMELENTPDCKNDVLHLVLTRK